MLAYYLKYWLSTLYIHIISLFFDNIIDNYNSCTWYKNDST